jgi:hypothetical protein
MTAPNPQMGVVTAADRLVSQLADGTDLNAVWTLFSDLLQFWNTERTSITDLLTFKTTNPVDAVPQNLNVASFEAATETGVPKAANLPGDSIPMGYKFTDYDLASRFTHRALRDMDIRAVQAVMDGILSADNKLTTGTVLRRLFSNVRERNEISVTCYDLYDGTAPGPPPYLGRTFLDTETHFITSGASVLDSQDIEDSIRKIVRKGYGTHANSRILVLANPDEAELVMSWRAGHESRPEEGSETSGPIAKYDFIPATNQPAFITPAGELVGEQVPGEWNGVKVEGSYGPSLLVQSDFVPSGYVAVVASYGPNSLYNAVGFREHPLQAYQGLRKIAGNTPGYPIVESFACRSFGVGIRQRGAAVCVKIDTDNTYEPPTAAQIPV